MSDIFTRIHALNRAIPILLRPLDTFRLCFDGFRLFLVGKFFYINKDDIFSAHESYQMVEIFLYEFTFALTMEVFQWLKPACSKKIFDLNPFLKNIIAPESNLYFCFEYIYAMLVQYW